MGIKKKKFRCDEVWIKNKKTVRCPSRFNRATINKNGHKICSQCAVDYITYK